MKVSETLTSQHILAIRFLEQRLGWFVKEAFLDEYNMDRISIDPLLGYVAGRSLMDLERVLNAEVQNRRNAPKQQAGDPELVKFAFSRYAKYQADHHVQVLRSVPPAEVNIFRKEQVDELLAELGLKNPELKLLDAADDPVVNAWNVARINRRRSLQRIGALYFLATDLQRTLERDSQEQLESIMAKASRYLFHRAADFQATELKFALLLGGEAQNMTKADIAVDSFGPGMSIIQYLNLDERLPGSYSSEKSDKFSAKIHEYAIAKS